MIYIPKGIRLIGHLVIVLGVLAWGQSHDGERPSNDGGETSESHLGYPQDWSSHHLVVTGEKGRDPIASGSREPRHVYNRVMREVAFEEGRHHPRRRRRNIKVDWAVSLENGFVPANQFPAKYRFDVTSESCGGDYVVFGLTITSGTQANIVGINNLYTEAGESEV
jgi:hypothetical protein